MCFRAVVNHHTQVSDAEKNTDAEQCVWKVCTDDMEGEEGLVWVELLYMKSKKITVFFCLNESVLYFFLQWFHLKGKSTKKCNANTFILTKPYLEEQRVSSCHVCLPDCLIQTRLTQSNVNERHWPPINVDASLNVRSNSCSLNCSRCRHVWAHKLRFIAFVLHWCCGSSECHNRCTRSTDRGLF